MRTLLSVRKEKRKGGTYMHRLVRQLKQFVRDFAVEANQEVSNATDEVGMKKLIILFVRALMQKLGLSRAVSQWISMFIIPFLVVSGGLIWKETAQNELKEKETQIVELKVENAKLKGENDALTNLLFLKDKETASPETDLRYCIL